MLLIVLFHVIPLEEAELAALGPHAPQRLADEVDVLMSGMMTICRGTCCSVRAGAASAVESPADLSIGILVANASAMRCADMKF